MVRFFVVLARFLNRCNAFAYCSTWIEETKGVRYLHFCIALGCYLTCKCTTFTALIGCDSPVRSTRIACSITWNEGNQLVTCSPCRVQHFLIICINSKSLSGNCTILCSCRLRLNRINMLGSIVILIIIHIIRLACCKHTHRNTAEC